VQADCRDGGELTVRPVKGQQRGQVDIAHPIAVCHHEGVRQPGTQAQDPPAGHGRVARVDDADLPVRAVRLDHPPRAIVQIHEVIAVAHVVIMEVFLDHLALIAAGDDEILVPARGVDVHDVPEHGLAADFHHRLGPRGGLLGQPRAPPTGQNHGAHFRLPPASAAG